MAVSAKIPLLPVVVHDIALPRLSLVPKPLRLDFAANPNHHRGNGKATESKLKKRAHGVDLSPRLELSLDVQCDAVQEPDPEME
jgi:hypothetical protein